MPAVSKAQFRLMKGICEGGIPRDRWPKGMTKKKACEFVKGQSPKGLPTRKKRKVAKKKKKLKRTPKRPKGFVPFDHRSNKPPYGIKKLIKRKIKEL